VRLALLFPVLLCSQRASAQDAPAPNVPLPLDPVTTIVDAFRTHRVVALGNVEFRGNEQSHAFQLALIRDARFSTVVNDIIVEFGSRQYQQVMDRFIAGADVPSEILRHAWQDTTQFEFEWDLPVYEDFFRAVRALNQSLPRAQRLRVLLGDPAVNWDKIRTLDDLRPALEARDASAVEVLQREVLGKGRRALVIYGGHHLRRQNADGLVARVESGGTGVFTVIPETRRDLSPQYPDVNSWPIPSIVRVFSEQYDALLYLGPPASMTMSRPAVSLCSDPEYMAMRLGRLSLVKPPPGAPPGGPAQMLKTLCAK
jgi:hypothetical protein